MKQYFLAEITYSNSIFESSNKDTRLVLAVGREEAASKVEKEYEAYEYTFIYISEIID